MENLVINIGNPRRVELTVLSANGVKVELSRCTDVQLILWINGRSKRALSTQISNDVLIADLSASELSYLGEYSGQVKYTDSGVQQTTERVYLFRVANEFFKSTSGTGVSDTGSLVVSVSTPIIAYDQKLVADAEKATADANAAKDLANTAATNANDKANLANTAARNADIAKANAEKATADANTATLSAINAATNANAKAVYANEQGDYAKQQGLNAVATAGEASTNANNAAFAASQQAAYAKQQGDYAKQEAQGIDAKIATKADQSDLVQLEQETNDLVADSIITESVKDLTLRNIGYITAVGTISPSDTDYRYTPMLRVVGGRYSVNGVATEGYCTVGYEIDSDKYNPVIIATNLNSGEINIPDSIKYIRISVKQTGVNNLVVKKIALQTKFDTKVNDVVEKESINNAVVTKGSEFIDAEISEQTYVTKGYINLDGDFVSDNAYRSTPYIRVYKGDYHLKCAISGAASIYMYENNDGTGLKKLINKSDTISITEGYNYIRLCTSSNELSLKNVKDIYIDIDRQNKLMLNLSNVAHFKGQDIISLNDRLEWLSNKGFIDSSGSTGSDDSWRFSDYILVFSGKYTINTYLAGGASICGYDDYKRFVKDLKVGNVGDGILTITDDIRYIRFSSLHNFDTASLSANSDLKEEYVEIKNTEIFDNLRNSENNLTMYGDVIGRYSHPNAGFKIPLKIKRPTAISFKFRINEDLNSTDGAIKLSKLEFANGDNITINIKKGVNELYSLAGGDDAWVSYHYNACVPKYNSGFIVTKKVSGVDTIVSTEVRNMTRKTPIVGPDAFSIRYTGVLNAESDGISLRITDAALEIYKGSSVIKSYAIVKENSIKELIERILADIKSGALVGYELKALYTEGRKQKELLKINEVRLVTNYYYKTDAWPVYIPYAIDEKWHTCEIYMDKMNHDVLSSGFKPVVIVSIDGVQTEITEGDNMYGDAILYINQDQSNIDIRDLDIQDGNVVGYERLNDPTVARIVSKYSKDILGLMGHKMLDTYYGSPEITNSGYRYDGSTDRLASMARSAKKAGYTCITVNDLADYYDGLKDIPNKCYFITFDDIEIDLWTNRNLRNYFTKLGIKPCLALVNSGGYTDGSGRPDHDNVDVEALYAKTPTAMRDCAINGWAPHMHGYTHSQVDAFSFADFAKFLNDGQVLGDTQGMATDIYTYSFGPHSVNTAKHMEHNGIRLAVTTSWQRSNNATGRYCISRINFSDIDNYVNTLFYDWITLI